MPKNILLYVCVDTKGSRRCHNKRCVVTKPHVKTQRCYSLRSKHGKKTSRYAGGATTEQIGASAQMRVALKQIAAEQPMNRNIQTIIKSLNDNVHSNELTRKKKKGREIAYMTRLIVLMVAHKTQLTLQTLL